MKKPEVGKKMSVSWPPQALAETMACCETSRREPSGERIGIVRMVRAVAPGMSALKMACSQKMAMAESAGGVVARSCSSQ